MILARAHAVRGGTSDDGFTLVELMVTMFVISFTLLGLIGVQVQALQSVGLSKQRQQASALANRTMEQLRALPYDAVSGGLNSGDLVGDGNVQVVGGVARFKPAYDSAIDEVLQTSATQPQTTPPNPLNPHTQDAGTPGTPTRIGNVQFRVRTYVSRVDPTADKGFHLTVIVDWSSAVTAGRTKTIAVRSRVYSPSGCSSTSTATRPFAGPCQAFFYSDAGAGPAGISVAPVTAGQELVVGSGVTGLEAKLPSVSVRTQSEQIVSAQSVVTTSEVVLSTTSGTSKAGGQSATSAASTDPASGVGIAPAAASDVEFSGSPSLTGGIVRTLTAGVLNGTFSVAVPASAPGSTYSTTVSTASPPCADDLGNALVTNQACSTGTMTPNGTYRASMGLSMLDRDLGIMTLASVEAPGTSIWRAYGARAQVPVSGHCTSTTGIGCVAAGARRALGAAKVGYLPDLLLGDTAPVDFTSLARLTGLDATVGSESGVSAGAPVATRGASTLTYWNGLTYATTTLSDAGATYTTGAAVGTYLIPMQSDLTVSISGTVTVEPTKSVTTGTSPCQVAACTTTSTSGAVRMTVQYEISQAGVSLGRFVVTSNLGSTVAQTTYKAAPSA